MTKRLVLFGLFLSMLPSVKAASKFAFREAGPDSLELVENGKPVYVYNYGMILKEGVPEDRRRSSYLHPVYAPDGTVITDDFPRDHYHHRGIFWTWPVVTIGGQTHDLWLIEGIRQKFVRWTKREVNATTAVLGVENGWYAGDRKVVKETVEIVAHPAGSNRRLLDFTLSFEALNRPVAIAGQQDGKGYGGFCIRFAPREDTIVRTDSGKEAKDSNLVPHPWAELEGKFEGHRAGARIEIDPSNPDFPNGWCLRHYGFLGVNFPGLEPYVLEPGRPLRLKYRVTVYSAPE
jgi:hypothetical protein